MATKGKKFVGFSEAQMRSILKSAGADKKMTDGAVAGAFPAKKKKVVAKKKVAPKKVGK